MNYLKKFLRIKSNRRENGNNNNRRQGFIHLFFLAKWRESNKGEVIKIKNGKISPTFLFVLIHCGKYNLTERFQDIAKCILLPLHTHTHTHSVETP